MQWNCRGLRANWEELLSLIARYSPVCICIQETMVGESTPFGPPGYHILYSYPLQDQGNRGGSAILVRRDIPFSRVRLSAPFQAVSIQLFLPRQYTVCSLYLPPSAHVERRDLDNLIADLPAPFLLLGDVNGRHPLWGDCTTNPRGVMLASVVEDEELGVLNSGDMTHFHSQTGIFTAIDVSLCSFNIILDFNWKVLPNLHGSDHFPIVLSSAKGEPRTRLPRWRIDKADWQLFKQLSSTARSLDDFSSTGEAVAYFTTLLHSAAILAVPKTSGHFPRRPMPWWTPECAASVKAKRAAFSRLRRHRGDPHYLEAFKRARAHARRVLKEARRASWKAYVSTLNKETSLAQIWKRVRKISGKYTVPSPPVLSEAGRNVAEPIAVAQVLAQHFTNVSRKDTTSPSGRHRRRLESAGLSFASNNGESYNVPFSSLELRSALNQCHDSSPGPDDIPYSFLRHIPDESLMFLLSLFNRIWYTGDYPSSWSVAVIIAIPKPGKDHRQATNYRPISLTSCLCKVMEKMVNGRLMWYLEKGNILSQVQYGFRKMRSTSDALLSLESSICEAFASNQHQVTVFFDLEKAYDTAWRHGILLSLHEFGLRGRLPIFIKQFLSNRFLRVRVGDMHSDALLLEDGVPQGSILSVTLFAVAINSVISVLPEGVRGSLYVDDLSISVSGSRMSLIERKLQLALNRISTWAETQGFRFSQTKTVAMHFCRLHGVHPDPDLYFYGRRISCVEETRFLGLIFDARLTWVPHLRYIKATCLKAINLLRVLAHTSWGADRQTLLMLHRSLILPKLEYGCEIYSSASDARLRMLDSVHHAGVRLATGAFRSCPIASMLVDAGMHSLDLRRGSLMLRCWYRTHRLPDSVPCVTASQDSRSRVYDARPSFPKPFGYRVQSLMAAWAVPPFTVCPHRIPRVGYWQFPSVEVCRPITDQKSSLPCYAAQSLFLEHFSSHEGSVPVYTDGSKSDTGAGFSVVFPTFCRGVSLPRVASVFTAEISAILLALKIMFSLPQNSFTVYSDSRSALAAIAAHDYCHPLILSILEWLYLLNRRGSRVAFCWVPAHVGVQGNEQADRLAKAAATRPVPAAAPHLCPLPCKDLYPNIRATADSVCQARWEDMTATTKMGEVTTRARRPWSYSHIKCRKTETVLARLRTGHTRYTQGFLMSRGVQPYCDDCLVPMTVRHLLVECPSLQDLREQYLSRCHVDGNFSLSLMLGEKVLTPGYDVMGYLREVGVLHLL